MQILLREGSSARWDMFGLIHPHLGVVFYAFVERLAQLGISKIIITSIIRPAATIDGETGIHALCRAIDISIEGISEEIGDKAMEYINNKYTYDVTRPKIPVVIRHDVGAGSHYHLQCKE